MNEITARTVVLDLIDRERDVQDGRWGLQEHPNGTGPLTSPVCFNSENITAYRAAQATRSWCDYNSSQGVVTWKDILMEEVFEAIAEDDTDKLKAELIQSAAVIVAWVEDIDRKANSDNA